MKVKHYKKICLEVNDRYLIFATSKNIFDSLKETYLNIPNKIIEFRDSIDFDI